MKRRRAVWLLVAIWMSFYCQLTAQYRVQLNAFTHTIDNAFFYYAGYKTIDSYQDKDGLIHYVSGQYDAIEQAKDAYRLAVKRGFENAQIVPSEKTFYKATSVAHYHQTYADNQLFIKRLSLKNGSGAISRENRHQIQEIVRILKEQPYLKLRVILPTNALSTMNQQQLKSIGHYLLANGIAGYRMRIKNASPDFRMAIEELTNTVVTLEKEEKKEQQLVVTLINHREEIVLDRFSPPIQKEQLTTSTMQQLNGIYQWINYL